MRAEPPSRWIRSGAVALGVSGLLFAGFPIVRPFYDDLARDPGAAALTISSPRWVTSHVLLILALVLLPFGLLALCAASEAGQHRRLALVGFGLGLAGAALFLPVGGVEAFALPAIAHLYLQGDSGALAAVDGARSGLRATLFLPALALLGLGGSMTGLAVWRSSVRPRWPGLPFALGLALFLPLLPQVVRVIDGLLIGIGALWLARGLWQTGRETTAAEVPARRAEARP